MNNKNFRIWASAYGLIGDLIFSLPFLTYFEKKYPGSYKIFPIEKKVSQIAPLLLNHPLIDKLYILENWEETFSSNDLEMMNTCNIVVPRNGKHSPSDWYNYFTCLDETARLAGLTDYNEILTEDEKIPKLYKWFPPYSLDPRNDAYSKRFTEEQKQKRVGIWPFAAYNNRNFVEQRSPNQEWWSDLVLLLIKEGYLVEHFGYFTEPLLSRHPNYTNRAKLSFFDQVRVALESNFVIGTDSGSSWVMAAYGHPTISITKTWAPNHTKNLNAFVPVGPNTYNIPHDVYTIPKLKELIKTFE